MCGVSVIWQLGMAELSLWKQTWSNECIYRLKRKYSELLLFVHNIIVKQRNVSVSHVSFGGMKHGRHPLVRSYQSLEALSEWGFLHPMTWLTWGNVSAQMYSPYTVLVFSSKQFSGSGRKTVHVDHWNHIIVCVQKSNIPMCLIATSAVWITTASSSYVAFKAALTNILISEMLFLLNSWMWKLQSYLLMKNVEHHPTSENSELAYSMSPTHSVGSGKSEIEEIRVFVIVAVVHSCFSWLVQYLGCLSWHCYKINIHLQSIIIVPKMIKTERTVNET